MLKCYDLKNYNYNVKTNSVINKAFFLGSKKFGLECLKVLEGSDRKIVWTILCPKDFKDKRSNFKEFKSYALEKKIKYKIVANNKVLKTHINKHKPNFMFVCSYYSILSDDVLKSFDQGVWGIHNSLLPKYRGGSPLVWQIINNEKIIGSSLFKLQNGTDNGPIIEQVKIKNNPKMDIGSAIKKIQKKWIRLLPVVFKSFNKGFVNYKIQKEKNATYFRQRKEADGEIDWQQSAKKIDCFIRAQSDPYPNAFFKINRTTSNRNI